MSVVSKYGVILPAAMEFVGAALMFGVALSMGGGGRYVSFAGAVLFAGGFLWDKLHKG